MDETETLRGKVALRATGWIFGWGGDNPGSLRFYMSLKILDIEE